MKDRLIKLRKALKLTQQKFADEIGVKRNTVATYEMGRNEPIDTVIKLICDKFKVNENWLRNGEGEMFVEVSRDDEFLQLIEKSMTEESGEFKRRLAMAVMKLTPDQIRACREWVKENWNLAEQTAATPKNPADMTREELHADIDAQLDAEESSKKSQALQSGSEDIADEA